jgi:hypothetical protein
VTAVNDAPTAGADNYSLTSGTSLNVTAPGVLTNDHDVDGDALTAVLVLNVRHGTLNLHPDGSFSYNPQVGFSGTDSFTYQASDGTLSSPTTQVTLVVNSVLPQFIVVDDSKNAIFTYTSDGKLVKQLPLSSNDRTPQGVASNADGSRIWIADKNGVVYVYDAQQKLLGKWQANGLTHVSGVTTNGTDIWLVDTKSDAILLFAGACTRVSGKVTATSSIRLNSANQNPTDLVTDGQHFWVLNDTSSVDKVFRYSMAGVLEGSWTIDRANSNPTGLALNPADPTQFWILDGKSRKLFGYQGGASRSSGNQNASISITLAPANRKAEAIYLIFPATAATSSANVLDAAFQQLNTA